MEKIIPKDSKIFCIMLENLTEIIAVVEGDDNINISVTNPLRLMIGRTADGQPGLNFMPLSFVAPETITLRKTAIISMYRVGRELEDKYLEFTSGISLSSTLLQG